MQIINHVFDGAEIIPTDKVSGTINPKYIMLHVSTNSADDLIDKFVDDPGLKESAHLIIDAEGALVQLAPLNAKTWHAGASYWQGHHGLNGFAIGIYLSDYRGAGLTLNQRGFLDAALPLIVQTYNIRDVMCLPRPGAATISVSRWKHLVDYGNADSAGRYIATATVDVYAGPDTAFKLMDEIRVGEGVKVLRRSEDGDWLFVLYERDDHQMRYGWTHESFFRRL